MRPSCQEGRHDRLPGSSWPSKTTGEQLANLEMSLIEGGGPWTKKDKFGMP
jgi:hypothetical protein